MHRTKTLIESMRILSRDIKSPDGVANAAIADAADRLEEASKLCFTWLLAAKKAKADGDLADVFDDQMIEGLIAFCDVEDGNGQDAAN